METPRSKLIPKTWQVPEAFHLRLGDTAGRQRHMDEEEHLLLILHEAPQATDTSDRRAAFFWRDVSGGWKSFPQSGGISALKEHLARYKELIDALDERVEVAESAGEFFKILREATPLLRATRHASEVLQKARNLRTDDRAILLLRDEIAELERAIDLVHADARDGLEFVTAENSAEQAQISHCATLESRRLNKLVAFFFPLATLISLFGINEPRQILQSGSFWGIVALGIFLGLVVFLAVGGRNSKDNCP